MKRGLKFGRRSRPSAAKTVKEDSPMKRGLKYQAAQVGAIHLDR